MDDEFLKKLQCARTVAAIPFRISSGYRCPSYNQEIGGVQDSSHTKGMGCDIKAASGKDKVTMLRSFLAVGFTRVGMYDSHVHVDLDANKPQDVLWIGESK